MSIKASIKRDLRKYSYMGDNENLIETIRSSLSTNIEQVSIPFIDLLTSSYNKQLFFIYNKFHAEYWKHFILFKIRILEKCIDTDHLILLEVIKRYVEDSSTGTKNDLFKLDITKEYKEFKKAFFMFSPIENLFLNSGTISLLTPY